LRFIFKDNKKISRPAGKSGSIRPGFTTGRLLIQEKFLKLNII